MVRTSNIIGLSPGQIRGPAEPVARSGSPELNSGESAPTDIVAERGDEAVACIKDMTNGIGTDSVLECVGTQDSMTQAIGATRPGGYVGYVGVPHGVAFKGEELFYRHVHLHGGPAPFRSFLPK